MNSPVSTVVLLVRTNVPSAGTIGLDGYDAGSISQGTLDIEVLLVVDILERPAVPGVLDPPLHVNVRISPLTQSEAETNLLIVALLRGVADDGLLILAREVTGGAGLFVGDKVSLSRRNHDVRMGVVLGARPA